MKYLVFLLSLILPNLTIGQDDTLKQHKQGFFALSLGFGNHASLGKNAINDAYDEHGQSVFSMSYTSRKIHANIGFRFIKYQILDASIFGETNNKDILMTEFKLGYRLDLKPNRVLLIPKISFGINTHHTQAKVDGIYYGGNVEALWNIYKSIGIYGEFGFSKNHYNYKRIPTKYKSYYDNSTHFFYDIGLKILIKDKTKPTI